MLIFYTIIFSSAVGVPKSAQGGGVKTYALSIFAGLIVFNLFSEIAFRAPGLLHEHADFIKKSIFPSETLAWTASIRALTYAGISLAVMLIFVILITHRIPMTALLKPFLVVPFFLFLLGIAWFLMALGSFTRDVTHLMASIIPVLMFGKPIFYSVNDAPTRTHVFFRLNIIGDYIEMMRNVLLEGQVPNLLLYLGTVAVSLVMFHYGYAFFTRYKSVFVDVI